MNDTDERRCICQSADGKVRCHSEATRDDGLCDFCRAAKEKVA